MDLTVHSRSSSVCPNNIATTANDFLRAFFHDMTIAIRLFLSCFGPSGPVGCVCNVLMLIKPVSNHTIALASYYNLTIRRFVCRPGSIISPPTR